MGKRIGKRTILLENKPKIISYGSIVGKKEHEGPIGHEFDKYIIDSFFGEKSFEKAESKLQNTAVQIALDKAKLKKEDIDNINNSEAEAKNSTINANDVEYNINEMTADENGIYLDVAADNIVFNLSSSFGIMLLSTVALVLSFVTVWFVGALCKAVAQCQTPFEENIIKKLQYLAYSLIPWAFFTTVSDSMLSGMMTGKTQINVGVDLGMVLVIVIIFALTYIFKYGAVLQQESDETL